MAGRHADLRQQNDGWRCHSFRGDSWTTIHKEDRKRYLRRQTRHVRPLSTIRRTAISPASAFPKSDRTTIKAPPSRKPEDRAEVWQADQVRLTGNGRRIQNGGIVEEARWQR